VAPATQKGFGSVVLEQVMSEYFDVPPRIDFAMEGLCYELNGSLVAGHFCYGSATRSSSSSARWRPGSLKSPLKRGDRVL